VSTEVLVDDTVIVIPQQLVEQSHEVEADSCLAISSSSHQSY